MTSAEPVKEEKEFLISILLSPMVVEAIGFLAMVLVEDMMGESGSGKPDAFLPCVCVWTSGVSRGWSVGNFTVAYALRKGITIPDPHCSLPQSGTSDLGRPRSGKFR